jgi:hypothetical protein
MSTSRLAIARVYTQRLLVYREGSWEFLVRRPDATRAVFASGFRRLPDDGAELAEATRLAIEAIEDEPWERWW